MSTNYLPTTYQQFIFISRYARWLHNENRRETWSETVGRYFNFFEEHLKDEHKHDIKSYKKELEEAVLSLKVMPSMRCLMTAGEALNRENIAGYNCSFTAVNRPQAFDEILYVLMNGTGVGFSVEARDVEKLPIVAETFSESDTTIVVADSKLGWAKALKELVGMLYVGQIPKWDVSKVRPAGAPLKTFGGRASGPEPLVSLFKFCIDIFRKAAGRKLTTLECHDIVNKIAEIVVVGGVRRSALISLSDLNDDRMRHAKSGQWWIENVQRALANNSAVYNEKPDIGIFMDEWKALYESKSGERGIFNRHAAKKTIDKFERRDSNYDFGVNPCLIGSTKVTTSIGVMTMEELSNYSNYKELLVESFNIHTQKIEYQPIMFAGKTKNDANVIELEIEDDFGNIHKITLTPDHLVYTENRGYVKAAELTEIDKIVINSK